MFWEKCASITPQQYASSVTEQLDSGTKTAYTTINKIQTNNK
jgi:hypothetical protein